MVKEIKICSDEQCTGCAACANACRHKAIRMCLDNEGFLRPEIEKESCIGCGLCQRICPANTPVERHKTPLSIYSGWSKNEEIRLSSASGGAFTELATYFIQQLHGIVFGVVMNEKLEACHMAVESIDDLHRLQGSKYIQSIINESYRQAEHYLKNGRNVLFSGTPCQIAGLRNYLRHDYMNLYTVDIICHGVPSKKLFDDYIKYLEKRLQHQIYDVKFRCKKNSWIYFNMAINSHVEKGSGCVNYEYEGFYYSDPFIRGFLRDIALRPSCYQCHYTSTSRVSDFTFADWWGYQTECVEDEKFEQKGVSLIFANSQKAQLTVPNLNLLLKKKTLDAAIKTNISLTRPFDMPLSRKFFWQDYSRMGFDDIVNKWLAPEQMRPINYVRYKFPDSNLRKFLILICRVYEKICRVLKCNPILFRA